MQTIQTTHIVTISSGLRSMLESMFGDEIYAPTLRSAFVEDRVSTPIGLKMIIERATKIKGACNREGKVVEVHHTHESDRYIVRIDWTIEDSDDSEKIALTIHDYLDRYPDMLDMCRGGIAKCEPYSE